jgi:hypothetical protein
VSAESSSVAAFAPFLLEQPPHGLGQRPLTPPQSPPRGEDRRRIWGIDFTFGGIVPRFLGVAVAAFGAAYALFLAHLLLPMTGWQRRLEAARLEVKAAAASPALRRREKDTGLKIV